MEEIHTSLWSFAVPSGLRIALSNGAVFGSMPKCSTVRSAAWPCMLDCPTSR